MTPWLVRLMRPFIRRGLNQQQIRHVEVRGIEHCRRAVNEPAGVLITPNHSFHYDSYVMIETSHRVNRPFHFLTAWQVFEMGKWFDRWMLQRHGCYSINREANDVQAFKTSIEILQKSDHPLVIFPEGDIYHHNDHVSPFRDGAAAIALSAAKRSERPILAVPCAIKAFYLTDPSPALLELMDRLESTLYWRPQSEKGLTERIYRFAEGLLALKELEYLNQPQSGQIPDRVKGLASEVLRRLEEKHGLNRPPEAIPERVKEVRRAVIAARDNESTTPEQKDSLSVDMEDLFFVIQLYSYPGNYVAQRPVIERIAETLDKFEEDVLRAVYPGIRGERHVVVQFGEPVTVPNGREGKPTVAEWTDRFEKGVQLLLDDINAHPPERAISKSST